MADKWIDIRHGNDRYMPPLMAPVLVIVCGYNDKLYNFPKVTVAQWSGAKWYINFKDSTRSYIVSHWIQIPNLPEDI
jgi:hypothetical protein